jgi:carbon starvation protein
LDVATRLGRYILQELFGARTRAAGALATLATVGVPLYFIASAEPPAPGKPAAYMAFWTLFGTSNQLLAALSLLGITVWLFRNRRPYWFTLIPMAFVMSLTLWSLFLQARTAFFGAGFPTGIQVANGVVAAILTGLAAVLVIEAILAARRHMLRA